MVRVIQVNVFMSRTRYRCCREVSLVDVACCFCCFCCCCCCCCCCASYPLVCSWPLSQNFPAKLWPPPPPSTRFVYIVDSVLSPLGATRGQRRFKHGANILIYRCVLDVQLCTSTSCLLYTSPSPRDKRQSRMPSSA